MAMKAPSFGPRVSLKDLSASIWVWHRENGKWSVQKVIEIPAEPADPQQLPPLLSSRLRTAPANTQKPSTLGRNANRFS
jgi:hypothetical protein